MTPAEHVTKAEAHLAAADAVLANCAGTPLELAHALVAAAEAHTNLADTIQILAAWPALPEPTE